MMPPLFVTNKGLALGRDSFFYAAKYNFVYHFVYQSQPCFVNEFIQPLVNILAISWSDIIKQSMYYTV